MLRLSQITSIITTQIETKLLIALLIITTQVAQADQATPLLKDEKAPFSGVLLPLPMAQDLQKTSMQRDNYKLLNDSLQSSLDRENNIHQLIQQKNDNLMKQNNELTSALYTEHQATFWNHFLYFSLGVAAAIASVYAAKAVTH